MNAVNYPYPKGGSWRRHGHAQQNNRHHTMSKMCCSCFILLIDLIIISTPIAAAIACIVMSSLRLKRQDYVDPVYQHSYDHKNIRLSLNIFYWLALSQGIIIFLTSFLAFPLRRMLDVIKEYVPAEEYNADVDLSLRASWVQPLGRYMDECLLKCINGDVCGAIDMDLGSFGQELFHTDSLRDQLVGVYILDYLLRNGKYKRKVLKRILASIDTVEKAVHILGLKTRLTDLDQDTRGHAARILLELAGDLRVETFPGILQSISSLLSIRCEEKEFVLLGVEILGKLVDDPDNCAKMKDAEKLRFQIIGLTKCCDGTRASVIDKKIVENSLKVLQKMVTTAGKTGEELRCQVSGDVHIIANITKILIVYAESQPQLLVQSLDILACLALDDIARKEIRGSCPIIRKLISLLVGEMDTSVEDEYSIRKLAAEALALLSAPIQGEVVLSTVSETENGVGSSLEFSAPILAETTVEDMSKIVMMLSHRTGTAIGIRTMVAKLLQNLRTYRGPEYADQLKRVDEALPVVLETIRASAQGSIEVTKGQLLESFIGLCVQICVSSETHEFTNALKSVNITDVMFVLNLKKILDVYMSPTDDYPGIRRLVIQQLNWMMKKDNKYISILLKHEMDKTLKNVTDTASKLEDFWLFRSSVASYKHGEPISGLLSSSLERLQAIIC